MSYDESTVPGQSESIEKGRSERLPNPLEKSKKVSKPSVPSPMPKQKGSKLELELERQLDLAGIPYIREACVIPGRRFRFDFALKNLLVEANGQTFHLGGHSSGTGLARDYEKTILAQLLGWRVFPVTKEMIFSGQALRWIQEALR
jgi:hypothetical protein